MATTIIPWAGSVPYGTSPGTGTARPFDINDYMNSAALKSYLSNLPGYTNAVGQRADNTQAMLQGQLPQDVIGQISQGAAERGISGGSPGSPNANAAYLRALGLNSLQLQQQGSQQLSQSIADTPVPELWNPMSLYVPQTLAQQGLNTAQSAAGIAKLQAANQAASAAWKAKKPTTTYSNYGGMNWG